MIHGKNTNSIGKPFPNLLELLDHLPQSPESIQYPVNLLLDPMLSGNTLKVINIISYFTKTLGFCDASNKTIQTHFPKMNGNLFKYYLANLSKKGYLFKLIIPNRTKRGSRRILVLEKTWRDCHKYWLKKGRTERAKLLRRYFIGRRI